MVLLFWSKFMKKKIILLTRLPDKNSNQPFCTGKLFFTRLPLEKSHYFGSVMKKISNFYFTSHLLLFEKNLKISWF